MKANYSAKARFGAEYVYLNDHDVLIPEEREIIKADCEMEMIMALAQSSSPELAIIFRPPTDPAPDKIKGSEAYITFYYPFLGREIPPKLGPNHYRFPLDRMGRYRRITALLRVVAYELSDHKIMIDFDWPRPAWVERLVYTVMVFRLSRLFPNFRFAISYPGWVSANETSWSG
ncbi:MAG: hypothetical protein HQK60_15395 [Deltaproteobacteria bacterium]|nr:hypothetical protein [Deltaproteobacteria bacterium]